MGYVLYCSVGNRIRVSAESIRKRDGVEYFYAQPLDVCNCAVDQLLARAPSHRYFVVDEAQWQRMWKDYLER